MLCKEAGSDADTLVVSELLIRRVHVHLRLDRNQAFAIAAREVKTLDLNMLKEFSEISAIGDEERIGDQLASMAKTARLADSSASDPSGFSAFPRPEP